jgi:hypothetical protein
VAVTVIKNPVGQNANWSQTSLLGTVINKNFASKIFQKIHDKIGMTEIGLRSL